MADELCCSLCLSRYSETEHVPLLLKCGHTYCKDCLTSARSQGRTNCPTCSYQDAFDQVERLPKNYLVLEMAIRGLLTRQSSLGLDPWSCSVHHSEPLTYFSKRSGKFYCSECYKTADHADLVFVDREQVKGQLQGFRELYEKSNPVDMQQRSHVISKLGVTLEGHKYVALENLSTLYQAKRTQIELQHEMRMADLRAFFASQIEAFTCARTLITLFKECKRQRLPFDSVFQSLSFDKQQALIQALIGYEEREAVDPSKILARQLEVGFESTISPKQLDLTEKVVDLSMKVMKEGGASSVEVDEFVAHRFEKPNTRWGIFDNRNQVEAVSFNVSRSVYLLAVGIGNSFNKGKSVMMEDLQIIVGNSTQGEIIGRVERIEMKNEDGNTKIARINFESPIKLSPSVDYTVRTVLKGESGVFRGTSVQKVIKLSPPGLTVTFKGANYHADDVKNGDNLEDGPIFDLHFSTGSKSEEVRIKRFASISGNWGFFSPAQVEAFTFTPKEGAMLSGVGICTSSNEAIPLLLTDLQVMEGRSTQSPIVLFTLPAMLPIPNTPTKVYQVPITPPVSLKGGTSYTLKLNLNSKAGAYRGQGYAGPVIQEGPLSITFEPALYEGMDRKDGDSCIDGPIADLYFLPKAQEKNFAIGKAPKRMVSSLGGEFKMKRFRGAAKGWQINTDSQVESFAFLLSKGVLLTAVGLGAPVDRTKPVRVKSLQILLGKSTAGPVVYSTSSETVISSADTTKQVARVAVKPPVRLDADTHYTLRVVMRGDTKVFKGSGIFSNPLAMEDGCTMTVLRSDMAPADKRNGDNETDGPIFYISYILPRALPTSLDVQKVKQQLFPVENEEVAAVAGVPVVASAEITVARYNSFGSSWHINADGKQVEAIALKADKAVFLTGLGVGNASQEGGKVTVMDLKVLRGKSTTGELIYDHGKKEKLINVGDDSRFVKVPLNSRIALEAGAFYTVRVAYKPNSSVIRGVGVNNDPTEGGVHFHFEKTSFDNGDVENGSHETHGPLRDFYFALG